MRLATAQVRENLLDPLAEALLFACVAVRQQLGARVFLAKRGAECGVGLAEVERADAPPGCSTSRRPSGEPTIT